jgi:ectoine hydroxylase-related dioxygenase (phytanoyl-CoA dioxygenase family)
LNDIRQRWDAEGWLHLSAFFSAAEVAAVNAVVSGMWESRPRNVTVDDLDRGRRCRFSELERADRDHRVKLNDLYLTSDVIRSVLLSDKLASLVTSLLGATPVLCNSLNLERSSAQDYHADSLFMTPRTRGALIAGWMALEPVHPEAGPLRLYPGSHRIPFPPFSDGTQHAIDAELPDWAAAMQRELDARALQPVNVLAEPGDLILWHANLMHGAAPIADPALTRKSLVAHYFCEDDARARGYRLKRRGAAYWWKRLPQPVGTVTRIAAGIERRVNLVRRLIRR